MSPPGGPLRLVLLMDPLEEGWPSMDLAGEALHEQFVALGPGKDDPSNKLLDVETQLAWLRTIGFVDVDCHWKWRELALLAGTRSGVEPPTE